MDEKQIRARIEEVIKVAGTDHYQVREESKGRDKVIVSLELSFMYRRKNVVDKKRRSC